VACFGDLGMGLSFLQLLASSPALQSAAGAPGGSVQHQLGEVLDLVAAVIRIMEPNNGEKLPGYRRPLHVSLCMPMHVWVSSTLLQCL
jgi:hypothetical protein